MCTLAISCLTISKLPWFMDLTFQVPMQYCSLQHRTLLPSAVASTTGCCFCLAPSLLLSGVISPLFSSSIFSTYLPGEFIFQCPIFLPFHTVHGVLKTRILNLVCTRPCIFHGILQARIQEWVGSFSLLQEIFPTQGLNPSLPHCRWILYQLSHKGSPNV